MQTKNLKSVGEVVRISKLTMIVALGALIVVTSACSQAPAQTPPVTRAATQTPWIIYVPQTVTPEPSTVTPLATVTESKPSRTPTKAVTRAPATKAPTAAPVALAPAATATPACNYGTVTLREPNDGAIRHTKQVGYGGDTFRFIWDQPAALQTPGDASVGYQITISSRHAGFQNGAIMYVSNNKYLIDGVVIMDKPAVSSLAGGADSSVTWFVTIVKSSGSFNDSDPTVVPPGLVTCGPPSQTWSISLQTIS